MESNSRSRPLTPLELEIMKVLWKAGPATVQVVQEKLPGRAPGLPTRRFKPCSMCCTERTR